MATNPKTADTITVVLPRRTAKTLARVVATATTLDPSDVGLPHQDALDRMHGVYDAIQTGLNGDHR
jgi:hypothetical protein